jgi:hypothetical protein
MPVILWFNDLPVWQAALFLTGGAVVISLVGTAVARVMFAERDVDFINIIGGFKYMFLSQVYAGFIGFLLLGAYDVFDEVRVTMVSEANALTSLQQLAGSLPEQTRNQLRTSLNDYAREVVDVEWPQMRVRSANAGTSSSLDDLEYVYGSLEVATAKQGEIVKISRELITELRNSRGVRMMRSLGSMPYLLWLVALLATAVSIVFPWIFAPFNVNAAMLMSILGILLMTSVVLVILKLTYPFGTGGVDAMPFASFLAQFAGRGG